MKKDEPLRHGVHRDTQRNYARIPLCISVGSVSLWFFFFYSISFSVDAQDTIFARHIIDTLTSKTFNGRGYTNNGVNLAMNFLENQFKDLGLKPLNGKNFIQKLSFPVNTFPGEMIVKVDGRELKPGNDYIVAAESRGLKGKFDLQKGDTAHFINQDKKFILSIDAKLTWTVSKQRADYTTIKVKRGILIEDAKSIEVNIKNKFIKKYKTGNVCGMVKGTANPDSFVVFTAHYDHLGGMGRETYFPGANDNSSGVSLLLGLAKWFAKNPQRYSVAFILFTGEEAGLMGSEYFVNHPLIPLKSIRFLVNLDLTGTGVEGITVVNATEFKNEFNLLKEINEKNHYLSAVNERGKAKNSDHYWFTEKGVSSFFIYTLGGIKAYHDVYDVAATLPNDHYDELFGLLREFTERVIEEQ